MLKKLFFCFCFFNLPSYGFTYIQLNIFFPGGLYCKVKKGKEKLNDQVILYDKALGDAGKEKKNFSNMEKPLAETGPGSGNHLLQPGPFGGEAMLLSWKRVAYPPLPITLLPVTFH